MKRSSVLALILCALLCTQTIRSAALSYSGSASYASGKYYAALCGVSLSGNMRQDIVAIAQSQVGYQEGSSASQLSGEVMGGANYTEYGRWYGLQDMWCAMFVSWCADNAGVPTSVVPKHSYTVSGLNQFLSWGRAYTRAEVAAGRYTPQPGDVIYFKSARNQNKTNHVGIVTAFSGSTIYTIEGNTSSADISTNGGAVCAKSYSTSNTFVVYVCNPDYTGADTPSAPTDAVYFPACAQSCTTITQGLSQIGADSSYAHRKQIAEANGIENYSGTAAQNNQLLSLLKAGKLIDPDGVPAQAPDCFPACSSSYTSLAPALESVGANASFAYRMEIAAANDIENYSGTLDQNTQMLSLLKAGTLKKPVSAAPSVTYFTPCEQSYTSLADALRSIGADSSFDYRKEIAAANNLSDYSGTAAQNTQLLSLLKAGKLIVPIKTDSSACSCGNDELEHVTLAETCDEDGKEYDRCTNCGAISNEIVRPATGHTYTRAEVLPTCTEDGETVYTCLCGDSYSIPTPALGHDFDAQNPALVTISDGTKTVHCSRCEDSLQNTPGDTDGDGTVSLRDVVLLQRAVAGWNVHADETNADVNRDGAVDLRDAALITRSLAGGWNVTLQFSR